MDYRHNQHMTPGYMRNRQESRHAVQTDLLMPRTSSLETLLQSGKGPDDSNAADVGIVETIRINAYNGPYC